ncbi:MAG: hypothetical protein U0176_27015 [Bacteroidia bacterium]
MTSRQLTRRRRPKMRRRRPAATPINKAASGGKAKTRLSTQLGDLVTSWQKGALFLLLALSSLISPLSSLKAQCTCPPDSSWQSQYDRANVILLGTCIDITPNTHKGGLNVVFNVDSSWKRAIEPTTTVHTNSPTQCGYPFQRGHRYLVFANKLHQTIATSICEPNQPADQATQALQKLGPGQAPGRTELASRMNLTLIGLGVLGMLFLAFVVLRKKVMKPKGR